ncbi:MAG: UDP-N-acetylmuramoyl-tripeptide--D-alanyl-D-alanine ligase [Planctomycetota bacterium]
MTPDFWTPEALRAVVKGSWAAAPSDAGLVKPVAGLWHDTRELRPGEAYLAIPGERFDGHAFVGRALRDGAALAIAERGRGEAWRASCDEAGLAQADLAGRVLEVDDAVAALQAMAREWRDWLWRAGVNVAAVLGSNGKTTTRSLLHHLAVGGGLVGVQSPKSFNNHLGAPLTLLRARPEHGFVACEIGTNHPGEVAELAKLVRPDLAVMTSIGEEHLEAFVDLDGVAREEWSILEHLSEDGRVLASLQAYEHLPLDATMEARAAVLVIDPADGLLAKHGADPLGPADHQRANAALAAEGALRLGANPEKLVAASRSFEGPEGRMQRLSLPSGVTAIHDAYNANPSSMRAALAAFGQLGDGPAERVAILGDMLELGQVEARAHAETVALAAGASGRLVLVGPRMAKAYAEVRADLAGVEATVLEDPADERWPADAAAAVRPGDAVLLKASRGLRLERVLAPLRDRLADLDAASGDAR